MTIKTIQDAAQAANQIAALVASKGTCFAGFKYNGKIRNVTLGKGIVRHCVGASTWGQTSKGSGSSIVRHNDGFYLQGVENNGGEGQIKRFDLLKIEGEINVG
jgi:hypothetical protein